MAERWWIEGTLTTTTPLHTGGEVIEKKLGDNEPSTEVAAVVTDVDGHAFLPGSTIKGNLRRWLEEQTGQSCAAIEALFGSGDNGGKAEFWDARLRAGLLKPAKVPHWDEVRQTGIEAAVVIDRVKGSAAQGLLRHGEYVPPGVAFRVVITGDGLTDEEAALLLAGLRHFSAGAFRANGYGAMEWKDEKMLVADPLDACRHGMWTESLQALDDNRLQDIHAKADAIVGGSSPKANRLDLELTLSFHEFFLINDPSQAKEGEADHRPLRGTDGKPRLPQRSLRGSLRSQAEKIIRTLGGHACRPDRKPCLAAGKPQDVGRLCPACRIFGAGGWGTVIELGKIQQKNNAPEEPREFVAIDRFTGGVAGSKKFNSAPLWQPSFTIELSVDLGRLPLWGLGLLALVFRDLAEGDILLGMAKRNNFGSCRATINRAEVQEATGEWLRIFAEAGLSTVPFVDYEGGSPGEELKTLINSAVCAFHDHLQQAESGDSGKEAGQ